MCIRDRGTYSSIDPFVETYVCEKLGLTPDPLSTQVLARDRHAQVMAALAVTASTLESIAMQVRLLQPVSYTHLDVYKRQAYKRFDAAPRPVPQDVLVCDLAATRADDVVLANNFAPAAEALLPELPSIREWLAEQAGSESVLLSGSGSATFALVDTFAAVSYTHLP